MTSAWIILGYPLVVAGTLLGITGMFMLPNIFDEDRDWSIVIGGVVAVCTGPAMVGVGQWVMS